MSSIAACIVSYYSDGRMLTDTVRGLAASALHASTKVRLTLTDNTDDGTDSPRLRTLIDSWQPWLAKHPFLTASLLTTGANRGYGAGNNAGLRDVHEAFVLVLNPDAVLEEPALAEALAALQANPDCSLLAPRALDPAGQDLSLGHAYPSVLALAGRAIGALGRWPAVRAAMDRYELAELDPARSHERIVCASGCFMLMPTRSWQAAGGFDEQYFLYFEDYDLSIRLRRHGPILYAPLVRLRHLGGDASGKGWRHTRMFLASAARFFSQHGLRWS